MKRNRTTRPTLAVLFCATAASGCAARAAGPQRNAVPAEYAILPDTSICIVDRSIPEGLREIPAKVRGDAIVLLVDGTVSPLEAVHPIEWRAGYAGSEEWVRRGEQITLNGDRFSRTGGERRIDHALLRRVGEYRGVLLFAAEDDSFRPSALYVPTAPACIFQAYVREDLIRR